MNNIESIKTILILGGTGLAGSTLAKRLLEESDANIILAGRNLDNAQLAATKLNENYSDRVSARQANAAITVSLQQAFEKVDLVVVAASTLQYTGQVAQAALEAGADYYDLMMATPEKFSALKQLESKIVENGRCFITEGGFFPGLPAAMTRLLAPRFDKLISANCFGLMLEDWQSFNFSGPTLDEMALALKDVRMEALQAGTWGQVPLLKAKKKHQFIEYGNYACSVQYYEEMRRLKEFYPSLQEAGVYSYGTNWFCESIFFPLSFIALKIAPKFTMKHFGRAFEWAVKKFQKPPYITVVELDASGIDLNGQELKCKLSISHEDGYAITAACNLSIVKQWLNGSIRKPGLHLQALVTDPEFMMNELRNVGVEVNLKET